MSPRHADDLAQSINSRNAHTVARADAAAGMVVAIAVAGLGAWALLTYLTPCEGATLCSLAVITRTRPGWMRRAANWAQAKLLRLKVRDLEMTLAVIEEDLEMLPEVHRSLRIEIDAARVRLIDLELSGRSS